MAAVFASLFSTCERQVLIGTALRSQMRAVVVLRIVGLE